MHNDKIMQVYRSNCILLFEGYDLGALYSKRAADMVDFDSEDDEARSSGSSSRIQFDATISEDPQSERNISAEEAVSRSAPNLDTLSPPIVPTGHADIEAESPGHADIKAESPGAAS